MTGEAAEGSWLPALHLRYAFNDDTNLRFAVTRSIARPNYYDLVPYAYIDTDGDSISMGNPNLQVTNSTNLDVFVERYFSNVGVLGGGFFYKSLSDPIFVQRFVQDYQGEHYRVTQPGQRQERDDQRPRDLLPAAPVVPAGLPQRLRRPGQLRLRARASATMPNRPEVQAFPGQSDHSGNFALWYEKAGFTGRIAFNYSGRVPVRTRRSGAHGHLEDRPPAVGLDADAARRQAPLRLRERAEPQRRPRPRILGR